MKVRAFSHSFKSYYNPSYGSLFRTTYYVDCNGQYRYTQNSTEVRDDLDYDELANLIKTRFSKYDKINILPMNGSDGTESYLIANSILNTIKDNTVKEKIFPIRVTDVDSAIIENYGQKGVVALKEDDIKAFGSSFDKYFEEINIRLLPYDATYSKEAKAFRLKPDFKKLFTFNVQDLQERIQDVNDYGNSVVIIRNCLAETFGKDETRNLISKLSKILHPNSLLVIGGFDRKRLSSLIPDLEYFGFKEVGKNIFSLNN